MAFSRYALPAFLTAVLSLFGLTQSGRGSAGSTNVPSASRSYSMSNGLHVQLMREAGNAYAAQHTNIPLGRQPGK